jgi:hypothetical protein
MPRHSGGGNELRVSSSPFGNPTRPPWAASVHQSDIPVCGSPGHLPRFGRGFPFRQSAPLPNHEPPALFLAEPKLLHREGFNRGLVRRPAPFRADGRAIA